MGVNRSVLVVVWIIQKKDSLIIIHFLVIKLKGWRSLKEASINKEKLNYHGQGGGGDFGWVGDELWINLKNLIIL